MSRVRTATKGIPSVFRTHMGYAVMVSLDFADPHREERLWIDIHGLIVSDELIARQPPYQPAHFKDRERRQNSRSLYGRFAQKIVDVDRLRADQIQDLRFQRIQDQFSRGMNGHRTIRRCWHRQRSQCAEDIVDASYKSYAVTDQVMAAFTGDAVDLSGQREDFPALLHRMSSRVQGSRIPSGFDHYHAQTQPADNSIPLRKQPGKWPLVNRHLTQ